MSEKLWKKVERRIARILAGKNPKCTCPNCNNEHPRYKRLPVTGRQRGSLPDIEHDWISVEIKHAKKFGGWAFIKNAMEQAQESAHYGEIPAVVLHKQGSNHSADLVNFELGEFTEWFGWIL